MNIFCVCIIFESKSSCRLPPWEIPYFKWQFVPEEGDREESPLETACRIGWLPGVKVLLDHGLSARNGHRLSYVHPPCALLWACKEGHAGVVKLLLERGADVECTHEGEFQQILAQ